MAGAGSKPGERRGGRQAGTPNKATAEVKELARKYGATAIKELARIAFKGESDTARIAAIKELLDRGYGKVSQPIDVGGDPDKPIIHRIERVIVDARAVRDQNGVGSHRGGLGDGFEKVGADIKWQG
jgi:hypothetical protein